MLVEGNERICDIYTPNPPLTDPQNIHRDETSGGPTYPKNVAFLRAVGAANQQRVVSPGRSRYEKGLAGRGLKCYVEGG